jgi:ankyrin repeat protein
MTALHYAAKNGHFPVVAMLCEYRADPNTRDVLGRTPIHYSVKNGQDSITEHLLVHFGIPDYELFKVCQSERTASILTTAIKVRDSFRGVGFLRKAKTWQERMRTALRTAVPD